MQISNKHVNELSSVHKVLKQGTDVNTTTKEQDTGGGAEQLVKSSEPQYNYKILQNSEKTKKLVSECRKLRFRAPKIKRFPGVHAPGPP